MPDPQVYEFDYKAVLRDDDPYYATRWDRALDVTVVAPDRDAALDELWRSLGSARPGKHWRARLRAIRPHVNTAHPEEDQHV